MTDQNEQLVIAKRPDARIRWKASEQPLCQIVDGKGNELGCTQRRANEPYPDSIARAWEDAAKRLIAQESEPT
jgi:hypothetical protein